MSNNSREMVSERDLMASTSWMDSRRLFGAGPLERGVEGSDAESDTTSTQMAGISDSPRSKRICLEKDLSDHGFTSSSEIYTEDSRKLITPVGGVNQTIADNLSKCCGDVDALRVLSNLDARAPLCTAVKIKHYPVAELLISLKADINARDEDGKPPLYYAIQNVDGKMTMLLLNNGAKVKDFPKLLLFAASKKYIEIVDALLKQGFDVNVKCEFGNTVLHFVVSNACKSILERKHSTETDTTNNTSIFNEFVDTFDVLLRFNANVNSANDEESTPLHISARNGNVEISSLLLNKGANINAEDERGNTPLHMAVNEGHADVVKLLLERGAEMDCYNNFYRYPLHLACERGHTRIVDTLLAFGDCIDAKTKYLDTPLHLAVNKDREDVVKLLLDRGAQVNLENDWSHSPLHLAAERGETRIIDALLKSGACVNAKTHNEETPLLRAAYCGRVEAVKLLFERGGQVHCGNLYGETPLYFATCHKNSRLMEILLKSGACINAATGNEETPLLRAAYCGREDAVKFLLERGAQVNCRNLYGETPLYFATCHKNSGLMEILLRFGACVNSRTDKGKTALHVASLAGNARAVAVLLDNGADISVKCRRSYTPFDYAWGKPPYEDVPSRGEYYRNIDINRVHQRHATMDLLFRHQVKMEAAGLNPTASSDGGLEDFFFECQLEIARMKCSFFADTNVSYFDILKKGSKCVAKYLKNKSIVLAFESEDYKWEFPIYAGIIGFKFREGSARKKMVERATQVFQRIRDWTEDCTAKVLDFLDDDDLKVFLQV